MGIQIKIADYLLCEDGERSINGSPVGPIDGKGSLAPGTDEREYIGADGIEPEHVGCDRKTYAFSVSRVYASPAEAFAAVASMIQPPTAENLVSGALPREGSLALVDGATTLVIMAQAALTGFDHVQVGCALALRYTFAGF